MAERQETSVMVSIQEILRDAQDREEQEKIEAERRALPPFVFAAEWECEFTDTSDAVFLADDVQAMFDDDSIEPLFPERTVCPG